MERFELRILGDLPVGLLMQEARALEASLGRVGLNSKPRESKAQPGERGDWTDFTWLIVGPMLAPIGNRLLDGLKQYFVRDQTVVVELARSDGAKIKIDAKNVNHEKVAEFVNIAKDALGSS